MMFDNFVPNSLDPTDFLTGMFFLFVIGLLGFGIWGGFAKRKTFAICVSIACGLALIGVSIFGIMRINASFEIRHQNEQVAENNLKKKYDIVDVLWSSKSVFGPVNPQTYDSVKKITVQDNNSNIMEFGYKLDDQTQEPYLLNDPDETHIKATDLLRSDKK